jgi:transcriptional regulator with XRE-family HTH domain
MDGLTLGERIKRARKRDGRQQGALAASAEINVFELSRWENDRCVPTLYAFAALADALQISMGTLYSGPLPDDAHRAQAGEGSR